MKTGIFISEGKTEIVLTPENEHERNSLGLLISKEHSLSVYEGEFYKCRGGYFRPQANGTDTILCLERNQ